MTWPTSAISTANLDSGGDNPSLARIQILAAVQDINSVSAEFGNVGVTSVANLHLLQYNSTASQWQNTFPTLHRYSEQAYDFGTTSGNILIDYANGNVQKITANANINISFSNFPVSGTVSLLVQHGATPAVANWPASVRAANNDRFLSVDANVADIVHISTVGSTSLHYVTVVRGYV
jgi:hypothetical protein